VAKFGCKVDVSDALAKNTDLLQRATALATLSQGRQDGRGLLATSCVPKLNDANWAGTRTLPSAPRLTGGDSQRAALWRACRSWA
jgi:hypothetical protein